MSWGLDRTARHGSCCTAFGTLSANWPEPSCKVLSKWTKPTSAASRDTKGRRARTRADANEESSRYGAGRGDGSARAKPVPFVDAETLQVEIIRQVDGGSIILTDEFLSYRGIGAHFGGRHETVHHASKQYARRSESGFPINTNTAESFFSLVKRGHYGVYHKMSVKHLAKYCDEFSFRWSWRKQNDSVRTEAAIKAAIKAASGKRLMYETPSSP